MALAETEQLTRMIAGAALSRAIGTIGELGVSDHIEAGAAQSVKTLARLTGTHERSLYRLLHCPHKVVLVPAELAWVLPCNDVPPSPAPVGRLKLTATEEHHPTIVCLDRPDLVIDLGPLPTVGPSRHGSDGR